MKNVNLSSIGSALLTALVASVLALGGCTSDTVTGPTPQENIQEAPGQDQPTDANSKGESASDDGGGGDGHNVGG